MRSRSITALVVTALTFLILLFWIFSFPFEEHKILAAIPGRASIVTVHDRLGERLGSLEESAFFSTLMGLKKGGSLKTGRYAPALKMYFGREVIIAKVPVYERPGQSAWVFSSWAGAANQWLRFGLAYPFIKGLKAERFDNGSLYWRLGEGSRAVSFSVRGGVLFGVYGEGGNLLAEMASRIDASAPDDFSIIGSRIKTANQAFPGRKDIAWVSGLPLALSSNGACLVSFEEKGDGVMIDFVLDKQIEARSMVPDQSSISAAVSGDVLDMLFISSWPTVAGFTGRSKGGATDTVMGFVDEVSGGAGRVFAGMLKQNFSGHIYNLKIPVLIAGIEVNTEVDVTKKVFELMDRLNAGDGLGVIPVRVPTEEMPIIVAGGSKMNFFGGIKQRPALVVDNGWLLVCSDMQSLLGLLKSGKTPHKAEKPKWEQVLSAQECAIGGYINFTEAEMAIRNIIAVYTLSLIADGEATVEKRKQLDRIRAVIEKMADIGEAAMRISSEGPVTRGQIVIRPAVPATQS